MNKGKVLTAVYFVAISFSFFSHTYSNELNIDRANIEREKQRIEKYIKRKKITYNAALCVAIPVACFGIYKLLKPDVNADYKRLKKAFFDTNPNLLTAWHNKKITDLNAFAATLPGAILAPAAAAAPSPTVNWKEWFGKKLVSGKGVLVSIVTGLALDIFIGGVYSTTKSKIYPYISDDNIENFITMHTCYSNNMKTMQDIRKANNYELTYIKEIYISLIKDLEKILAFMEYEKAIMIDEFYSNYVNNSISSLENSINNIGDSLSNSEINFDSLQPALQDIKIKIENQLSTYVKWRSINS